MNLKSFITNDELVIDKPNWYKLKNEYSQQELKDAISDAIEDLPLPLYPITEQDAKQEFDELVKFDDRTLLTKDNLYSKADYKYELSHWYLKIVWLVEKHLITFINLLGGEYNTPDTQALIGLGLLKNSIKHF